MKRVKAVTPSINGHPANQNQSQIPNPASRLLRNSSISRTMLPLHAIQELRGKSFSTYCMLAVRGFRFCGGSMSEVVEVSKL